MTKKRKTAATACEIQSRSILTPFPHGHNGDFVVTSSRTQAPKPPVKPTRVRRPKARLVMWIPPGRLFVYWPSMNGGIMDSTEARARAAWLLHAAAWLEQEARRGTIKKGTK